MRAPSTGIGFATLFILLLPVFLTGCNNASKEPVTIAVTAWPGYGYVLLAEEKGFFKEQGVNAVFDVDNSSLLTPTYNKYLDGNVKIMLVPINYAIDAKVAGVGASVVMYLDSSDTSDVFIVPPSVTSYADLKGKALGVEGFNSYSHIFVLKLLEKNGLQPGEYELKQVAGEDVLKALDAGTIGGGYTWGATKAAALEKGYVILGRGSDLPRLISDVMVVQPQFATEHPEAVQGIMLALLEAREYAQAHPEEAYRVISERMHVPQEDVQVIMSEVALPGLQDNIEAMTDSDSEASLYRVADAIADFYIDTGQIAQKPDVSQLMDPTFINTIAVRRAVG